MNHQWAYARIDRIESNEEAHCVFCNRALRSGRLIVLRNELAVEAFAGPSCAKKHTGEPSRAILDLSKMAMSVVYREDQPASDPQSEQPDEKPRKRTGRRQIVVVDEVEQYLRLRAEHMPGFTGAVTQRLREIHAQLATKEGLADDARRYVERLLFNAGSSGTIYAFKNIERCIGAAYWLKFAIKNTKQDRRDFLEKMLDSLQEHWRLTARQIEAINRWGEGIRKQSPSFPVLDTAAFEGVQIPRFARAPSNGGG